MESASSPKPADCPVPEGLQALQGSDDVYCLDHDAFVRAFRERFDKGEFHAGALFRSLYRKGQADPSPLPEFAANPALVQAVKETFSSRLPEISGTQGDGVTYKFLLRLPGGLESESVVIPMRQYKSLCVSSQVGCKMGCTFCETAQMGFLRNLTAGEIVAQVMVARHVLKEPVENVVFMGMGEPMDNLDNVLQAIRILSDQRGLDIPQSAITVSTVGHVDGIRRFARLAAEPPPAGFSRLRLAVSLNAPNDLVRSRIMPVNKSWDLAALKAALREVPLHRKGDFLFMEYVLIPGVNDAREHALQVADFLRGLRTCVNLIPYNPRHDSPYARPVPAAVSAFYHWLMDAGQYCRIRGTKGQESMAACGQLGNRELKKTKKMGALGPPRAGIPALPGDL